MNKKTLSRLEALRSEMAARKIDAFIIPGTDPHQSEYYAEHWDCRTWISGFDGSAGTAVVTMTDAGLWTDSRYFLQAAEQLEGSGFTLFKEGLPETPSYLQWLIMTLPAQATVGIDGMLFSAEQATGLSNALSTHGLKLISDFTPFDRIWLQRPGLPLCPFFIHDTAFSGETAGGKIVRTLRSIHEAGADALFLTALDEIAWLFNIRGHDVRCNPVVYAYAYIDDTTHILFIDERKIDEKGKLYLQAENIEHRPYESAFDFAATLRGKRVWIDPAKTNQTLLNALIVPTLLRESPIARFKAIKNAIQIKGIRNAMIRDGVALVRFFRWLDNHIDGGTVTEMSASEQLRAFRAEQALFVDESFDTIAGFNEHGAIVHYTATPESDATLSRKGFLLMDSGAQYIDGTTDITRTVALGTPTAQQKRDFTLVLKGHISLASCRFPKGTRGAQLDALARRPLWDEGLSYLHGTGHGVGHFLNVHEGPQSIRLQENPTPLMPGMVTSCEPGLYRAGEYGIRHENLLLTIEHTNTEFGEFYGFEPLTLFPFDKHALEIDLLSPQEIAWLNDYHRMVYDRLQGALTPEEREWLREATSAI